MKYQRFIALLEKWQTTHIKPLCIPRSCAPSKIPEAFQSMIRDIIHLLEENSKELARGKPIVGLLGLQVTGVPLESKLPIILNRIYNFNHRQFHLCCTLFYLPLTGEELRNVSDWSGAENLIIDFTSGVVMDKQHYLYKLFNSGTPGKVYGYLNKNKLTTVWQKLKDLTLH